MARNKNIKFVDVPRMTEILKDKINEGYKLLEETPISDSACARIAINMLEFDTTIQQMNGLGRFRVVEIPTKMEGNEIEVTDEDFEDDIEPDVDEEVEVGEE